MGDEMNQAEYDERKEIISRERSFKIKMLHREFAEKNKVADIGDVVKDLSRIIVVKKIVGGCDYFSDVMTVQYFGYELTKKLKLRKDESYNQISQRSKSFKVLGKFEDLNK